MKLISRIITNTFADFHVCQQMRYEKGENHVQKKVEEEVFRETYFC